MHEDNKYKPFDIYRPTPPDGRIDRPHEKSGGWRPSYSYKSNLIEVERQFTPAEFFRYRLVTSGKIIRLIQRLDLQISKDPEIHIRSAVSIQAAYRGMKGREYFNSVRQELYIEMLRRGAVKRSVSAFNAGNFELAIQEIDGLHLPSNDALEIKLKSCFRSENYQLCISTCDTMQNNDETNEISLYLAACSWVKLSDFDQAYERLQRLSNQVQDPTDDSIALLGFVASHLDPPLYDVAVTAFGRLIKRNPRNYAMFIRRASAYFCLQDWYSAIKDLNFVLAFRSKWVEVLLMRARAYTCIRDWDNACEDYLTVLSIDPHNAKAVQGIKEIEPIVIDMPMIDETVLYDT